MSNNQIRSFDEVDKEIKTNDFLRENNIFINSSSEVAVTNEELFSVINALYNKVLELEDKINNSKE